jgi:hypothetical protein
VNEYEYPGRLVSLPLHELVPPMTRHSASDAVTVDPVLCAATGVEGPATRSRLHVSAARTRVATGPVLTTAGPVYLFLLPVADQAAWQVQFSVTVTVADGLMLVVLLEPVSVAVPLPSGLTRTVRLSGSPNSSLPTKRANRFISLEAEYVPGPL